MREKPTLRRGALSMLVLAAGLGLVLPTTLITASDVKAQTAGMERRQERRESRHERREDRREGRHERREERRGGSPESSAAGINGTTGTSGANSSKGTTGTSGQTVPPPSR